MANSGNGHKASGSLCRFDFAVIAAREIRKYVNMSNQTGNPRDALMKARHCIDELLNIEDGMNGELSSDASFIPGPLPSETITLLTNACTRFHSDVVKATWFVEFCKRANVNWQSISHVKGRAQSVVEADGRILEVLRTMSEGKNALEL